MWIARIVLTVALALGAVGIASALSLLVDVMQIEDDPECNDAEDSR